jgi:DHA1 family tetracycline resistance protein-like MFS transporter
VPLTVVQPPAPPAPSPAPAAAPRTLLGPLLPLYLVIHVGFVGYGAMMVLFVEMIMRRSAGYLPAAAGAAERTRVVGFLLALYPVGQFFGTPVLSSLSDRFGRKRVLVASLSVTTACYLVIALALQLRSLALLSVALLVCGLGEANVAIAQSAIADVSAPADRGRLFGYVYVAIRLGYVTGPLLGSQLAHRSGSYATPFWVMVGLLAAALIWTQAHFRETHPARPGRPLRLRRLFTGLLTIFSDRPLRLLYAVNFLLYVAIFGFSRTIVTFLVERWRMNSDEITLFYTYFGAAVMVANLGIMPYLARKAGEKGIAIWTAVAGGLLTVAIGLAPSKFWLWIAIGPASCLLSLCLSACAALLADAVSDDREGEVMGNNEALQVAAQALGAVAGGFLASLLLQLPIVAFGALVIASALLLFRVPAQDAAPQRQA